MRKMKDPINKADKLLVKLVEYSQSFDILPPRGDGAKLAVAQEIHGVCTELERLVNKFDLDLSLAALNAFEAALLARVDHDVEEMKYYD